MSEPSSTASRHQSRLRLPSHPVAYFAVLAATVSGVIHLVLAPGVLVFSTPTGVLFMLNGLGWFVGIGIFLSRYWRDSLYLMAGFYALLTILAFVVLGGQVTIFSITAKSAESIVFLTAGYLYMSCQ